MSMKKRYGQQKANNSRPEPSGLSRRKVHNRAESWPLCSKASRAVPQLTTPLAVRAPPAAIDVRWNAGDAALAQHRLADLGLLRSKYSRFATLGFIDAENLFRQPGPRQEPGQTMTAGRSDCGRLLCPTSRRAPA